MNKATRLSKSGIEYLDYVWNFYSGCLNSETGICPLGKNCWAKGITVRFRDHYPNGFEPTFYPEAFLSPMSLRKPSIIGVAFMGDLFGDWVDPEQKIPVSLYGEIDQRSIELAKVGINPVPGFPLKEAVFTTIRCCPQHTFLFLTKCPWNLPKWSPFPDNCWVGVTATNSWMFSNAVYWLSLIEAKVKYLSLEPLQERILPHYIGGFGNVQQIIIGAQTRPTVYPRIEWVQEILVAAHNANIPVFMKDNLQPLIDSSPGWGGWKLRQELPK